WSVLAFAGGPRYAVSGAPITWPNGTIYYYTDQGDLSPLLPGPEADALVASAFAQWATIPTAAVTAIRGGRLEEDVSGANTFLGSDGSLHMTADVLPTALSRPVAIVYDSDGSVSNAILGKAASNCFLNAVFGRVDNFAANATFSNALIVLNGKCAQTASQLPDMQYRMVRLIGKIFGLDWSQVNINVLTRLPEPTIADFDGFSLMHAADTPSCVPISSCLPNAFQPKLDDQMALSRLYPVTIQNRASFPGKKLFFENTIRIHGSVFSGDTSGSTGRPVQGINVVARWIDAATAKPSRQFAASSVSGFLFRRYPENTADALDDAAGRPPKRLEWNDTATEGFFDLAGLPIPDGSSTAQFELSVEPLDPHWSRGVSPYISRQVRTSGSAASIIISASIGSDVRQDIVMQKTPPPKRDNFQPAHRKEWPRLRILPHYMARTSLSLMAIMRIFFPVTAWSRRGPVPPAAPHL
ncbi:MAG: hypothetical protein M3O09_13245, partial [Acidobacteriota bacterium]|nr:hypothetical protein [Acidobacteriota bacterium]